MTRGKSRADGPATGAGEAAAYLASHAGHAQQAVEAARLWMSRSLQAAQGGASWMQELERQFAQVTAAWIDALALGVHEAEQADSLEQLMAVLARIVEREVEAHSRQQQQNLQRLLDNQSEWLQLVTERAQVPPGLGDWQALLQRWFDPAPGLQRL